MYKYKRREEINKTDVFRIPTTKLQENTNERVNFVEKELIWLNVDVNERLKNDEGFVTLRQTLDWWTHVCSDKLYLNALKWYVQ